MPVYTSGILMTMEAGGLIAVAALVIAGLLVLWGLFGDAVRHGFRRSGVRRCPKCWYDLSHTPCMRCSECGHEAKHERRLHRFRRRWRFIAAAVMMVLVSHAARISPDVRERGWVAAVPTTALVLIAPFDRLQSRVLDIFSLDVQILGKAEDPLLSELLGRCERRELWSWQWHVVFDRFFDAHPRQLEQMIETRPQWPRDLPIMIRYGWDIHPFGGNEDDVVVRVRLADSEDEWHTAPFGRWRGSLSRDRRSPILGLPSGDAGDLVFEVEILTNAVMVEDRSQRTVDVNTDRAVCVWRGTKVLSRVEGAIDDALEPFISVKADKAVAGLSPNLLRKDDGSTVLGLWAYGYHIGGRNEDWALGAAVEILRDGEIVGTGEVLYPMLPPGTIASLRPTRHAFELNWLEEPPKSLDGARWQLRMRGEPMVAIYDIRRSSYWTGDITVPITKVEPYRKYFWKP